MAEFLIKARGNQWMENLPVDQWHTKGLTQEKFDARHEKGEVCTVRPDGWVWGNKECLPGFVLVKVPGLNAEIAKRVIEQRVQREKVVDGILTMATRKHRYHFIPQSAVDTIIQAGGVITVTKQQLLSYLKKWKLVGDSLVEEGVSVGELDG